MNFKEKRGNVFVFDNGSELENRGCTKAWFWYGNVGVNRYMAITLIEDVFVPYEDIQTAVNLMQILIKEGLV